MRWATSSPSAAWRRAGRDVCPEPLDIGLLRELRLGGDRGALEARAARDRPAGPRSPSAAGSTAARSARSASRRSNINYRHRLRAAPAVDVTSRRYPTVYRDFGGDEAAAIDGAMAGLDASSPRRSPPSRSAAILIEPVQGEGGYYPAPPAFLRELRASCDRHGILLIADEVQSGFGRTGQDVGLRARRDRPRRRRASPRRSPTACRFGDRDAARAPGALGTRRARLDVRRQSGLLRGRGRRARDHPRAAPDRERGWRGRRALGRPQAIAAEDDADRRRPRARA